MPFLFRCALNPGYNNLSRRHARLQPAAEGVWIEDLGSTNGVFINENRLTPHQPFLLAESGALRLAKDFVATVQMAFHPPRAIALKSDNQKA